MSKKPNISGTLSVDYKSFREGFTFCIEGPLSLISGVNGSGKSQLLTAIDQQSTTRLDKIIQIGEFQLNSIELQPHEVGLRSFKQNHEVGKFGVANPSFYETAKSEIARLYEQTRLNPSLKSKNPNDLANIETINFAKSILEEKFGVERFNRGSISKEEIFSLEEFQSLDWHFSDPFTNSVSNLFYRFAFEKIKIEREFAQKNERVNYSSLGKPPWQEFNELFELLAFNYRFNSDYEIIQQGFNLSENPKLKTADGKGLEIRELADLSDGEKTIFSLAVGSMQSRNSRLKVLLLDEFEATLNPSLTEALFVILEKFFVDAGIFVVMTTHSPLTIAMAPDWSTFYEMYPQRICSDRIRSASRTSYAELRRAFEPILKNSEFQRALDVKDIEAIDLEEPGKTIVLVEGPTDVKYLNHAVAVLGFTEQLANFKIKQIGYETEFGSRHSGQTNLENAVRFFDSQNGEGHGEFIILFDPEVDVSVRDISDKVFVRKMHRPNNTIQSGIEALLSEQCIIDARTHATEWFSFFDDGGVEKNLKVKNSGKMALCDWVCSSDETQYIGELAQVLETILSCKKTPG